MGEHDSHPGTLFPIPGRTTSHDPGVGPAASINSTGVCEVRIRNFTQRPGQLIADVSGAVYAEGTGCVPVTLDKMEYSTYGTGGPWVEGTILDEDPAYYFPPSGLPSGYPFNVPTQMVVLASGLWVQITMGL